MSVSVYLFPNRFFPTFVIFLQSSTAKSKAKGYQMRGKLAELRKELKDRERRAIGRILSNADVVLSTLTTASDDGPLRNLPDGHFQVAVIDECSQVGGQLTYFKIRSVHPCQ